MTSKPSASECFVYITLPAATSAVTAGRFGREKNQRGDPLGRLIYDRSYLANPQAVPIDPLERKLAGSTYETIQMNGVFGALRDAGPDDWGRRVIEKHARKPQLVKLFEACTEAFDPRQTSMPFRTNQV